MRENVVLIGYGSIGRRHAYNLIKLGITPYVLTLFPDNAKAVFIKNIKEIKDRHIDYCIVASPTGRHLKDFSNCIKNLEIKNLIIILPNNLFCCMGISFLFLLNCIKAYLNIKK